VAAAWSAADATSPGVATATTALKPYLKAPTSIGISTPLSKKPAAGKRIYFLQCSQPVCTAFLGGLKSATAALGWKVEGHSFTQTPEGIQSAVQAAVDAKPDGIFFTGISPTLIPNQLAAAKAAGIPIVAGFDVAAAKSPLLTMLGGSKTVANSSRSAADWLIADSKGKANVLIFTISAYTILNLSEKSFSGEIKRLCPGCKTKVIDNKVTDVGTNIPAAVVSAIQRDPSVTHVAFAFGDMPLGVAAALKSAGLEGKVKIVSYGSASPTNLSDISKGNMSATSAWSIPFNSWQAIDVFARHFVGDPIPKAPPMQSMVITKATAKSQFKGDAYWDFAGPTKYQAAFKKLWHVG
jgi:ribose transport system substrate-binding protein